MIWIIPSEKDTNTAALTAEQTLTLRRQIHCFRPTRDLLPPRLLSGQVELKTKAA